MNPETYRQAVHLGGLAFIILAQFSGRIPASVYFFAVSVFFLVYAEYIKKEKRRLDAFSKLMEDFKKITLSLERTEEKPFAGAFWFYFSLGIIFLFFPLPIASASGAVLAVGDSLSTIAGIKFGKHRTIGNKTLEGSLAFFAGSLIAGYFFVGFFTAFFTAILSSLLEILPEVRILKPYRKRGLINDNWIVPVFSALFMYFLNAV